MEVRALPRNANGKLMRRELAEAARLHLREKFLRAKMAISGGNFIVAETGTLVIVESEGNGRMCLTLPKTLVSVVGIEKIVRDWGFESFTLDWIVQPNAAIYCIVIAAICFMLTKIELTDADVARSESLKVSHALELAKNGQFWMLLLFTLFVTQIYDTYDQQFAQYFSLQFPTPEEGNRWYGILASIQVCGETLFLCLMPWFVNRTGAKWALIIAGLIMSVRIVGSAVPLGPVWIGAVKMMHALEKPLILVSVFKFIAANFDHKLSSTVYLLVLFVASIATAIYSPLAGYLYDTIGFANTYLILGSVAGLFTLISIFTLQDKREPKKTGAAPSAAVNPAQ